MNSNRIIEDGEIKLDVLFKYIASNKGILFKTIIFFSFLSIFYAFFISVPLYKSSISLLPVQQNSSKLGALSKIAQSFDFDITDKSRSLHITDIVESRVFRKKIIDKKWYSNKYKEDILLIDYWDIKAEPNIIYNPYKWLKWKMSKRSDWDFVWQEKCLSKLKSRIEISKKSSGLILIDVFMEEPSLAADIANFAHQCIVDFNFSFNSKQATEKILFIEGRMSHAKNLLDDAENQLKNFRENNRNFENSPQLQMLFERLLRNVDIQTQVYITLKQQI